MYLLHEKIYSRTVNTRIIISGDILKGYHPPAQGNALGQQAILTLYRSPVRASLTLYQIPQ
jgi:hypothetical protein